MITREQAGRLREQLVEVLAEDVHNTERLMARLESVAEEAGIEPHSALLLILTSLSFDEAEARRHWDGILEHRHRLSLALGRDVGVRVALMDYFMNVNRQLAQPTVIELELVEAGEHEWSTDPLTGLVAEPAFRGIVQTETRRAKRYGQRVAVAAFDLDDFAETNRRHGKLLCDRLLREAAILLKNKIRDIDVAARPGEDELAVVLPETDRNGALLVAERFRSELAAHFSRREAAGRPVGLTISAGVASYPDDATTPEALIERAAQALYRAKATGKNAVQAFVPERRRYLRFDLEPGRFEVEVLEPPAGAARTPRNLSRSGILFVSPEALQVGEEIEIRLVDSRAETSSTSLRARGRVVRLEEIPEAVPGARGSGSSDEGFEVGVAFDVDWAGTDDAVVEFLERAQARPAREQP